MAMTKEEQSAAARRIMEKMGPMDELEREIYEGLVRSPDDYVPPDPVSGWRVCGVCQATFTDQPATRDRIAVSALEQFSDHQAEHNPTPGQWAEAYHRLQQSKPSKVGT